MEKFLTVPKGQNFTFFLLNIGKETGQSQIFLNKNLVLNLIKNCDDCYAEENALVFVWYTNELHCHQKEVKVLLNYCNEWVRVLDINIPGVKFDSNIIDSDFTSYYISAA